MNINELVIELEELEAELSCRYDVVEEELLEMEYGDGAYELETVACGGTAYSETLVKLREDIEAVQEAANILRDR